MRYVVRTAFGIIPVLIFLSMADAQAQTIPIYEPVPPERITATASSSFAEFDVSATINGDGLKNHRHQSHNLGGSMWISKISKAPVRSHSQTKEGVVWLMYTLVDEADPNSFWMKPYGTVPQPDWNDIEHEPDFLFYFIFSVLQLW